MNSFSNEKHRSNSASWIFISLLFLLASCSGCGGTSSSDKQDSETEIPDDRTSADPDTVNADSSDALIDSDAAADSMTTETLPNPDADKLTGAETAPEIVWIHIEAGSFTFGSPETSPCRSAYSEKEVPVTLTRSFEIAETELTQAQWETLDLSQSSWSKGANKPVTLINFFEAAVWCNKLSKLEGLEPCYNFDTCRNPVGNGCVKDEVATGEACSDPDKRPIFTCSGDVHRYEDRYTCPGYRLPTTAEWEYAAKAGVTDTHTYGGDLHWDIDLTACSEQPALEDIAWYCNNSGEEIHPVAQKLPNPWGLFDTLGNAEEWTDYYRNGGAELDYDNPGTALTDPIGPLTGDEMDIRGQYYNSTGCLLRPSDRLPQKIDGRSKYKSFRPVRTIFK